LGSLASGANSRPVFGLIGCGNRGRFLHTSLQKLGAQCAAICDVYEPYLELARKTSPQDVKSYVDYRDLLAARGLDFVVIATPDHHHCPMLLDSLNAGLDVYLEKPISLSIDESRVMVEAVRKASKVVQVGMHRRSMSFIHEAAQLIRRGDLGEVTHVEAFWNWHFTLPLDNSPLPGELDWKLFLGSARQRDLEPRRFRWWRGFWDYSGGNMTDQGTHLMDVVQWMTDSAPPVSATCQGQIRNAPGVEVPNIFSAVFEYPKFLATWTLNYRSAYEHDWWIVFRGESATMVMNRRGYQIHDDPGASGEPWSQRVWPEPSRVVPMVDSPEAHMANFLEALKARKDPSCPIEVGAAAVAGPHMANIAYRAGRRAVRGSDGKVTLA
jgi:predicted dehydrogenase